MVALVLLVACGGDGDGEEEGGGGLRGCLEDTGFRILDEEEPRFGADEELQVDTGVEGAPSFIGVFVYGSEDEASAGEDALVEADASTTEVVGRTVLTGTQQQAGAAFETAADEIRDCVSGG